MTGFRLSPRRKRLLLLLASAALLLAAGAFVKQAFRSNLVFFVTPSDVAAGQANGRGALRVGGLVQAGSLMRNDASGQTAGQTAGLELHFKLSDAGHALPVVYRGVLPDLFAEGKGAIAQGHLDQHGTLQASEVLAKHDENYVPAEMQDGRKIARREP
jgi:cytochrome c-type biogenesis protein CcmE